MTSVTYRQAPSISQSTSGMYRAKRRRVRIEEDEEEDKEEVEDAHEDEGDSEGGDKDEEEDEEDEEDKEKVRSDSSSEASNTSSAASKSDTETTDGKEKMYKKELEDLKKAEAVLKRLLQDKKKKKTTKKKRRYDKIRRRRSRTSSSSGSEQRPAREHRESALKRTSTSEKEESQNYEKDEFKGEETSSDNSPKAANNRGQGKGQKRKIRDRVVKRTKTKNSAKSGKSQERETEDASTAAQNKGNKRSETTKNKPDRKKKGKKVEDSGIPDKEHRNVISMETISTEITSTTPEDEKARERTEEAEDVKAKERTEEAEKKSNVGKRIVLVKDNNKPKRETSPTLIEINSDEYPDKGLETTSKTKANIECRGKESTENKKKEESDPKRSQPRECRESNEMGERQKNYFRIPRRTPEDTGLALQIQASKEDEDFFLKRRDNETRQERSRSKDSEREEAPRRKRTDPPTITIQCGSISSNMREIKEKVEKLRPFEVKKLGNFRNPCMFFNLDVCQFENVIEHRIAGGSKRTVSHICAICYWADKSCEPHRCRGCPTIQLKQI